MEQTGISKSISNMPCIRNIAKSTRTTPFPAKRLILSTDASAGLYNKVRQLLSGHKAKQRPPALPGIAFHFLFICIFSLLVLFPDAASAQETFQYTGYLESDSVRKAYLTLTFSGTSVTGNLKLDAVCQSNARLPGAEFNLKGTVKGSWEGKGSNISADWSGKVKWCGKAEKRNGQLTIAMKNGDVYFDSNGSYYNKYIFTPLRKVYKPSKSSGRPAGGGPGITSGPPSLWKRPALTPEAPLASSLGPPRKGFRNGIPSHLGKSIFGTVEMSLNETRTFIMPLNKDWTDVKSSKHTKSLGKCKDARYYPDSRLSIQKKVGDGVNVKATGGGIGKVYANKTCDCIDEDGVRDRCTFMGVWLVVIGEEGFEEYTGKKKSSKFDDSPKPDIARASIKGRAVLRNSKKPVANVRISLVTREGGSFFRPNWKTGSNGKFSIKADNMLRSGVYEVLAHKIYADDMGTKEDPFTVDKDLWPIKKYLVTITKENTRQGSINVGDIELDTVDNIFNKGKGRKVSEKRGSVKKRASSKQKGKETKKKEPYSPSKDPNIKRTGTPGKEELANAKKFKSEFRKKQRGQGKSEPGTKQASIKQPDTYTSDSKKQNSSGSNKQTYPPDYPPYDDPGYDTETDMDDFTEWIKEKQPSRESSGGGQHDTAEPADSDHSTPLPAPAGDTGTDTKPEPVPSIPKPRGPAPKLGLNLVFENKTNSPVHIFIHGFGEKMGPGNRIGPGGTRNLHSTLNAHEVVFVAGRNGQELTRATWVPPAGSKGASLRVIFTKNEKLEVK